MKHIAVITTGRADFGIYLPLLKAISTEKSLKLSLIVSGMHLEKCFGMTVREIEDSDYRIAARVPLNLEKDNPESMYPDISTKKTPTV